MWFSYRHLYKPPFTPIFFWVLFAATFLLAFPAGAITGNGVSVLDGDTIEVLHNQYPERIRLNGIDCPEKNQAFGKRAKQAVSELVYGKEVTLQTFGKDKYGRTIADVGVAEAKQMSYPINRRCHHFPKC